MLLRIVTDVTVARLMRVAAVPTLGMIAGCGSSVGSALDTTTGTTPSPFGVFTAHVVLKFSGLLDVATYAPETGIVMWSCTD